VEIVGDVSETLMALLEYLQSVPRLGWEVKFVREHERELDVIELSRYYHEVNVFEKVVVGEGDQGKWWGGVDMADPDAFGLVVRAVNDFGGMLRRQNGFWLGCD
jgi:hypothetical protein